MSADVMCAAPLIRGTEFILDDQGVRMFGCCGQRGLASVASSALGSDVSTLGIYDSMLKHGWADPGGASTIGDLLNQAKLMNCEIASFAQYNEPWGIWQSWLTAEITAGNPSVIELAYGQALFDSISQRGENAVGLRYHFIGVLGYFAGGYSARAGKSLPEGFWCADGDNFAGNNDNAHGFAAADVLQYYPITVLAAAHPCGGLALKGRAVTMAWTEQADGSGKDDKGHTCGAGFMGELSSSGDASSDGLLSETAFQGAETFLPLENGRIYYWNGAQVLTDQGAQVLVHVWNLLEAAKATPVPPTPAPSSDPYEAKYTGLKSAVTAAVEAN